MVVGGEPFITLFTPYLTISRCIIAGAGDLGFDAVGYFYSVSSCVMQATFLVLVEVQVWMGCPC